MYLVFGRNSDFYYLNTFIVEEVMVIAGGRDNVKYKLQGETYHKTLDVVNSDGNVCEDHDLTDLPEELEGFGMASRQGRYIYVCGGQNRGTTCFYHCGNYIFLLLYF